MSDFLVYWPPFWNQVDDPSEAVHDWRTNRKYFFKQVNKGDNIWVVVSGGPEHSEEWRLIQRVCVERLEYRKKDKEFKYYAIGNDSESELFDPNEQSDFAPILRRLMFASGRRIRSRGRRIGLSLRAIRPLTSSDAAVLMQYAQTLKRIETK